MCFGSSGGSLISLSIAGALWIFTPSGRLLIQIRPLRYSIFAFDTICQANRPLNTVCRNSMMSIPLLHQSPVEGCTQP